jgi:dTDP-L-rhamnose 4-epimerase
MKNVLISGGAGFIGSNLALRLTGMGCSVTVLDCLSSQIHGMDPERSPLLKSIKDSCEVIVGDVRDRASWKAALDGKDTIIHLAAETGTGQSMYEIERYTDVNVSGTAILLDILTKERNTIERIAVASSRAIYGEGKYSCHEDGFFFPAQRTYEGIQKNGFEPVCPTCGRPLVAVATDEDSKIAPSSIYGITKQVQEELIRLFGKTTGMPAVALRYQNVYGPGQSLKNPYTGILSIFSTALLLGGTIDIFEDGKESRDFVYIDDVVTATIKAIDRDIQFNDAINVGTGVPITVLRVAQTLKSLYSSKSPIEIGGKFRIGDIRHNFADLSYAKESIGFEFDVDFDEGLRRFSEWVRTQAIEEGGYRKSIAELQQKGMLK